MPRPNPNSITRKLGGFHAGAAETLRRLLGGQPRWAPVLATTVLALALVPASLAVSAGDLGRPDHGAAGVYRALDSSVQRVYALGASLVNDLRLIYNLHARLGPLATTTSENRAGLSADGGDVINCSASSVRTAPSAEQKRI